MTWNEFQRLQDITYLDWNHKRDIWCLHRNLALSIQSWVCAHPDDVFLFPRYKWNEWDSNPFHHRDLDIYATSIYAPIQSQRLIFMDPTFGTKNVKYHLFALMAFYFHHTKVPVVWVIANRKICENLVEWLNAMRTKLLSCMPHWKPLCFIVDDVP